MSVSAVADAGSRQCEPADRIGETDFGLCMGGEPVQGYPQPRGQRQRSQTVEASAAARLTF